MIVVVAAAVGVGQHVGTCGASGGGDDDEFGVASEAGDGGVSGEAGASVVNDGNNADGANCSSALIAAH